MGNDASQNDSAGSPESKPMEEDNVLFGFAFGYFFDLPVELQLEVLHFLSVRDLTSIALTSRHMNDLSNTNSLWMHLVTRNWQREYKKERNRMRRSQNGSRDWKQYFRWCVENGWKNNLRWRSYNAYYTDFLESQRLDRRARTLIKQHKNAMALKFLHQAQRLLPDQDRDELITSVFYSTDQNVIPQELDELD